VYGVVDRVVAGAAAQVALEFDRQVFGIVVGERCGRHDHAGGAEAALEALGIEELLLHRVQGLAGREAVERGDLVTSRAIGRRDAAVEGAVVDPDGAGAAIAGVAPFADGKPPEIPEERPQTLAGSRLLTERLAVDRVGRSGRGIVLRFANPIARHSPSRLRRSRAITFRVHRPAYVHRSCLLMHVR
jgi:hypothetical protein